MPPKEKKIPKRSPKVKADKEGSKLETPLNITRREIQHPIFQRLAESQMPKIIADAVASKKHLDQLEASKKEAMSSFNAEIKEAKEEFDGHMTLMDKGETIYVACEEMKDFEAKTVTIYRLDTREQVDKRDMTDEDHQLVLNEKQQNADSHEEKPKAKKAKPEPDGEGGFTDWPAPEEAMGDEEMPKLPQDQTA